MSRLRIILPPAYAHTALFSSSSSTFSLPLRTTNTVLCACLTSSRALSRANNARNTFEYLQEFQSHSLLNTSEIASLSTVCVLSYGLMGGMAKVALLSHSLHAHLSIVDASIRRNQFFLSPLFFLSLQCALLNLNI